MSCVNSDVNQYLTQDCKLLSSTEQLQITHVFVGFNEAMDAEAAASVKGLNLSTVNCHICHCCPLRLYVDPFKLRAKEAASTSLKQELLVLVALVPAQFKAIKNTYHLYHLSPLLLPRYNLFSQNSPKRITHANVQLNHLSIYK